MNDTRNVLDEFKGLDHDAIIDRLDQRGVSLEIAIENTLRDFNMGSIVRSANAFGVRVIHVIGRKQWNKRGAMMTDKYLEVRYYDTPQLFAEQAIESKKRLIAIENNIDSSSILDACLPDNTILIFGQEGPGISDELLDCVDEVVHIPQRGSTRSLNVGVAAGIALFEWTRRNVPR